MYAILNIPHILYYVYFVLTYAILNISHIYTMYILCHSYLFPCNMLVIGFSVFIHVFVYLIISYLILDFMYSYHARFRVFSHAIFFSFSSI